MNNCYLIDLNSQIDFIFENIDLFNSIRKRGHDHAMNYLNETKNDK